MATNQLSGYGYDAAGNMTHDLTTGNSYTYDQENRITGAAGYTYTYDADGNRVEKSNGNAGTIYWYMTPGIVAESDLSGNLQSEYVFFDSDRVARKDLSGSTTSVSYYFSDHLKTASVITNSAGTITEDEDYYPWGGEIPVVNSDSNHYKFTGKERDTETGLDYFGARYYGNWTGRFLSPDPLGGLLVNPQSLNRYTYVRNNPLRYTDPTGMYTCSDSGKCDSKLDKSFESARQQDLKSKDANVVRAAQAYGDPTKDGPGGNKVNVSFGDLSKKGEGGTTTSTLGGTDTGFIAKSDVVIDSKLSGAQLDATVGHEGSHVADAQEVVKSIGQDATGQFKVGQDITQYQSEQRAYAVSDSVLRSGNASAKFACGVSDCVLGKGLALPGQVPAEVDRILLDSYKSAINHQPLSSTNQGASVVPH